MSAAQVINDPLRESMIAPTVPTRHDSRDRDNQRRTRVAVSVVALDARGRRSILAVSPDPRGPFRDGESPDCGDAGTTSLGGGPRTDYWTVFIRVTDRPRQLPHDESKLVQLGHAT